MGMFFVAIGIIIGLFIYIIIKDEKRINKEHDEFNIKVDWLCDYIGGIPLFDKDKNNINARMYVQIRRRTNSLYLSNLLHTNSINININDITNMGIRTREQIINKQISPSLGKILAFGVFAMGMGKTETERLTDKYLIIEYKEQEGVNRVFALKTNEPEDYIREIKYLKGEEYTVDIKNCI